MRFHGGSIMLLISMFLISCDKKETLSEVVERGLNVSSQQTMFLAEELENQEKKLPRTYENNELKTVGYKSWVSGFFPGVLWYLYENDPTEELKRYAELYTSRVEPAKNMTSTHDLGFMLYDMDYSNKDNIQAMFFRAVLKKGVLDLRNCEVIR